MIDPLTAAKLVHAAYDPTFVASGALPDLGAYGCSNVYPMFGFEAGTIYPYGFLATIPDGSQVIALRGTMVLGTQDSTPLNAGFALHDLVIHWLGHIIGTEWLSNGQLHMVQNPWGPGRVHSGFLGLTQTLGIGDTRDSILSKITSLANLAVAGHSRGAAAARLLAMRLGHIGSVMTWGEPRSCDGTAASYAESCSSANRRTRNPRDLVPTVPVLDPCRPLDLYKHVGDPNLLPATGDNPVDAHAMTTYIALEGQFHSNP